MIGILLAVVMSQDYPNKSLTPGVTREVSKKELCTVGSTKDARHVTAKMKREVFHRYGFIEGKYKPGDYEIDHFLSLENFGSNSILNLWPQKFCPIGNDPSKTGCLGAREKDAVEHRIHQWFCKGIITQEEVISILKTDWIKCYKTIKSGGICHTTD